MRTLQKRECAPIFVVLGTVDLIGTTWEFVTESELLSEGAFVSSTYILKCSATHLVLCLSLQARN